VAVTAADATTQQIDARQLDDYRTGAEADTGRNAKLTPHRVDGRPHLAHALSELAYTVGHLEAGGDVAKAVGVLQRVRADLIAALQPPAPTP